MRVAAIVVALVLSVAASAAAQEWEEFVSKEDGFKVDFPGTPKVTDITWKSQLDYILPGKVYSVDKGKVHYSMTVVDYRPIEQQGIERSKTCEAGNAQCRQNAGIMGPGYWRHDERGGVMYATFKLLQRDAKLTSLAWEWQDMVEGNFIQLTNNADQSRMTSTSRCARTSVHPRGPCRRDIRSRASFSSRWDGWITATASATRTSSIRTRTTGWACTPCRRPAVDSHPALVRALALVPAAEVVARAVALHRIPALAGSGGRVLLDTP
jgi:hypothetical protein